MSGAIAYTDGSCLGNPGPGGWGVRILYPDGMVRELGATQTNSTNNRMELQAVIAALEHLGTQPLTVYTDSRYVLDGLTKWLPAWQRRGWVTTAGTPVKNRVLWQRLAQLAHADIRWQHVRGHSGDPNNERVDVIARTFASGVQPPLFQGRVGDPDDPVVPAGRGDTSASTASASSRRPSRAAYTPRYVSIVQGVVAVDTDWSTCAARVRSVSGARCKKVRSPQELAAFCAQHGVDVPSGV